MPLRAGRTPLTPLTPLGDTGWLAGRGGTAVILAAAVVDSCRAEANKAVPPSSPAWPGGGPGGGPDGRALSGSAQQPNSDVAVATPRQDSQRADLDAAARSTRHCSYFEHRPGTAGHGTVESHSAASRATAVVPWPKSGRKPPRASRAMGPAMGPTPNPCSTLPCRQRPWRPPRRPGRARTAALKQAAGRETLKAGSGGGGGGGE